MLSGILNLVIFIKVVCWMLLKLIFFLVILVLNKVFRELSFLIILFILVFMLSFFWIKGKFLIVFNICLVFKYLVISFFLVWVGVFFDNLFN